MGFAQSVWKNYIPMRFKEGCRGNWAREIGDGFQFLLTEGGRKRLVSKALTILSKESASRETVMAQIEEILTEKKKAGL